MHRIAVIFYTLDVDIVHRSRKLNKPADCPLRLPLEITVAIAAHDNAKVSDVKQEFFLFSVRFSS